VTEHRRIKGDPRLGFIRADDELDGEECVECGAPATEAVAELGRDGWEHVHYCDDCVPLKEES
jgi:hypothetical protein